MAILFDLDGTLLDTAQDLVDALNLLLAQEHKNSVNYANIRPIISFGGKKILSQAFNLNPDISNTDKQYLDELLPRYLELYKQTNFRNTRAFSDIDHILIELENMKLPWGIVTNKITSLTEPLLKKTGYFTRSACVVCGDTTNKTKPDPMPLQYACKLLNISPTRCLYIGDSETDIIAGRAAQMRTMAVGFGYIPSNVNIQDWHADYTVNTTKEILPWIKKWSEDQK